MSLTYIVPIPSWGDPVAEHSTDDRLMTLQEVADYLGVPIGTLYQWRARAPRMGPPGYRVGRHVRFHREQVDAWLKDHADRESA